MEGEVYLFDGIPSFFLIFSDVGCHPNCAFRVSSLRNRTRVPHSLVLLVVNFLLATLLRLNAVCHKLRYSPTAPLAFASAQQQCLRGRRFCSVTHPSLAFFSCQSTSCPQFLNLIILVTFFSHEHQCVNLNSILIHLSGYFWLKKILYIIIIK